MNGQPAAPERIRAWCACGSFFASHTAWFFHRDANRPGCRSIGAREWAELHGQRAAS